MSTSKQAEDAVVSLLGRNVTHGSVVKIKEFEDLLQIKRDNIAFGFLITEIRHALYAHGLYLSGDGSSETGCYEILDPEDNRWVAKLALARAERDLDGKQTLLLNTKTDTMNEKQRRRHEAVLQELSFKLAAMRRAKETEERFGRDRRKLSTKIQEGETS
jgi:hypothetical protein